MRLHGTGMLHRVVIVGGESDQENQYMRIRTALILLSCLQPFFTSAAHAGSGNVINLPMGIAPKNGLRLEIDTRWVDANGYRPLRITATNLMAGPTSPVRTLRVELTPQSWRWRDSGPTVSGYIERAYALKSTFYHMLWFDNFAIR